MSDPMRSNVLERAVCMRKQCSLRGMKQKRCTKNNFDKEARGGKGERIGVMEAKRGEGAGRRKRKGGAENGFHKCQVRDSK
jgi:hypothetical protein